MWLRLKNREGNDKCCTAVDQFPQNYKGNWRKLADQFRMDKRKYCPHPAASFGNFM